MSWIAKLKLCSAAIEACYEPLKPYSSGSIHAFSADPHLLAYSPESAIAEKFQSMVQLDSANSRMKDFYDIWLLATGHPFDGSVVSEVLQATFTLRLGSFLQMQEAPDPRAGGFP